MSSNKEINERNIARDTLVRYSGSKIKDFQKYILLTNFPNYVDYFAKKTGEEILEGSMMKVCHSSKHKISILDYKIGSPAAALAVDLISFVNPKACLMLGMCGGLRRKYKIGEYLLPVASVRGEGTSNFYFPERIPALSNFLIQRALSEVLDKKKQSYHIGITHSTNIRFWEFDKDFRQQLIDERVQAIEMECATLFIAGYKRKVPIGALLLISDKPLEKSGIKTMESSKRVKKNFTDTHVDLGIDVMLHLQKLKDDPKDQID
jgi:AMP nucleosidase